VRPARLEKRKRNSMASRKRAGRARALWHWEKTSVDRRGHVPSLAAERDESVLVSNERRRATAAELRLRGPGKRRGPEVMLE